MTYRPNLPLSVATTASVGGVKSDGSTVSVAVDGTLSVPGTSVTGLTAITTPATADLYTVNQGGTDYKATGVQVATFVLAQSLTPVTISGATTLSFSSHNKRRLEVAAAQTITVPAAATLTAGFECTIVATGSGAVTLSGTLVNDAGASVTSIAAGSKAMVSSDGITVFCELGSGTGSGSGAGLTANTFTGAQVVMPVAIAYASSVSINAALGNRFRIGTLTGAISVANPTNLVDGQEISIRFVQDSTGGRAVTLGSYWVLRSGDSIPTAANSVSDVSGTWDSTAGKIRAGVVSWAS